MFFPEAGAYTPQIMSVFPVHLTILQAAMWRSCNPVYYAGRKKGKR
jgi:hypothetical protein